MNSAAPCGICDLDASRYEIAHTELWRLRHHADPAPLLGWLFLDAQRHLGGPVDFTALEAESWGPAVQSASQLVRQLTGCDRVYAIAFGEGARHLHLHLIPRFGDNPSTAAWSVADHYRAVAGGDQAAADPEAVAELVRRARQIGIQTAGGAVPWIWNGIC